MANTDKEYWDITYPKTATSYVGDGAREIYVLREAVEDRLNKEHVEIDSSGAGGEHLEGSARIHVSDDAPTVMVVGAKTTAGAAADVNIADAVALSHGMVWADSNAGYTLKVYNAGWQTVSYLALAGGTIAGDVIMNLDNGANKFLTINCADTGANPSVYIVNASAGAGLRITNSKAAGAAPCLELDNAGTGECLDITSSNGAAHFNLNGDPANSSPGDGDYWFDGTNMKLRVATVTNHVAMSAGTTGGTDSAGVGKQYVALNIGGTIYKVLHDGTV